MTGGGEGNFRGRRYDLGGGRFAAQKLASPGDGVTLVVEQVFEPEDQLDVALAVKPLLMTVSWSDGWKRSPLPSNAVREVLTPVSSATSPILK